MEDARARSLEELSPILNQLCGLRQVQMPHLSSVSTRELCARIVISGLRVHGSLSGWVETLSKHVSLVLILPSQEDWTQRASPSLWVLRS